MAHWRCWTVLCPDRDHARVSGTSLWRREDQNLPGCPLADVVHLHKDFSMTMWHKHTYIQPHLTVQVSQMWVHLFANIADWHVSLTRLTCTLEPCLFRCVLGGTCTCLPSSCWWSLRSTPLQVDMKVHYNSNILLCKQKSQRQTYCIFWNVRLGTCLFLCANKISVFQVVSLLSFTQTPSRRLSCSLVQLS